MGRGRALFLLLLAGCADSPRDGEGSKGTSDDTSHTIEGSYTILWVGDTMLADAAQDALDEHGYDYPFQHLRGLDADYSVGNAESPITLLTEPYYPDQTWSYHAHPKAAAALADIGFDAMSMANNHLMDRGPDGVHDTRTHLAAAGMTGFGAGVNAEEAGAPLWIDTPDGAVAVIGMTESSSRIPQAAEPEGVGAHTFSPERVTASREAASLAGARWVVAFVHWGNNYDYVEPKQRELAGQLVDAGYDLVIGHGAHVPQAVELLDGVPVLYSLGNFVFGTPGRFDAEFPGRGLMATTYFGPGGLHRVELRCILTDNDGVNFQPRPCSLEQAATVFGSLGPSVQLEGDVGVIAL